MSVEIIQHIYRLKRGTEQKVFENDPILNAGEPIVVTCDDGIVRMKIGDGVRHYNDLPFINQENDQSLKALLKELQVLKDEISDAGDTVYRIEASKLSAVSGSTVSKRITKYLESLYPTDRLTLGNTAIVSSNDPRYSEGILLETYVYDGKEWLANINTYTVDGNSLVMNRGNITLHSFDTAKEGDIAVKKNGSLSWSSISELSSLIGIQPNDPFLSVYSKRLGSTIRIVYIKSTNEIALLGNNGNVVSKFSADDISFKLDKSSEEFLSFSDKGLKLSGVQDAIDTSRASAEALAKDYTDSSIKKFTETYITDQEETIAMLKQIAEWIESDQTGTTQIISDVQANKISAKRHDEAIEKIQQDIEGLAEVYQTEEDVDNIVLNKINELKIHIIDGGRITDGSN